MIERTARDGSKTFALHPEHVKRVLNYAALNGNIDIIRYICTDGRFGVTRRDVCAGIESALNGASSTGHLDILRYICEDLGFAITANDLIYTYGPVYYAFYNKRINTLRYLCDTPRFGIDATNIYASIYMMRCGSDPDIECFRYICEHPRFGIAAIDGTATINSAYAFAHSPSGNPYIARYIESRFGDRLPRNLNGFAERLPR